MRRAVEIVVWAPLFAIVALMVVTMPIIAYAAAIEGGMSGWVGVGVWAWLLVVIGYWIRSATA
jgi:hypothetical protein